MHSRHGLFFAPLIALVVSGAACADADPVEDDNGGSTSPSATTGAAQGGAGGTAGVGGMAAAGGMAMTAAAAGGMAGVGGGGGMGVPCGNGVIDTGEQCDGGAGCGADCMFNGDGSCAAGLGIELTDNAGTLEGSAMGTTVGAGDDVPLAPCRPIMTGGGEDILYFFDLPDTRDVLIALTTPVDYDGSLRVTTTACDLATALDTASFPEGCADDVGDDDQEVLALTAAPAGRYFVIVDGYQAGDEGTYTLDILASASLCGDGNLDLAEECDDMNADNTDGCTDTCQTLRNWECANEPSVCMNTCGDGLVDFANGEECDDGNGAIGDRCTPTCLLEFDVAEAEPNDTNGASTVLTSGQSARGELFSLVGEYDAFQIAVTGSMFLLAEVYTTVDGDTGNYDGAGHLNPNVDCGDLLDSDPYLSVYDQNGDVSAFDTVAEDDDNGAGFCSFVKVKVETGTYYLRVDEIFAGYAPHFILDVELRTPLGPGATCVPALDLCDPDQQLACNPGNNQCAVSDRATYEAFTAADYDLDGRAIELHPYADKVIQVATHAVAALAVVPGSGTTTQSLTLANDASIFVNFANGFVFPAFGTNVTGMWVGDNGVISFTGAITDPAPTPTKLTAFAGIAGLWTDLDTSAGGTVTVDHFSDRVAVSWVGVPQQGQADSNTIQIVLWRDGHATITHLGVAATNGLVGASTGDNGGFAPAETNISATAVVAPIVGDIMINEVLGDNNANDANCDGLTANNLDEFVELVNVSGLPLDLTALTISDAVQVRHTFPQRALPADGVLVVYGGGIANCAGVPWTTASTSQLGINNTGDTITLTTAGATVVSRATFAAFTTGISETLDADLNNVLTLPDMGNHVDHDGAAGAIGNSSAGYMVDGAAFFLP